MLGLSDIIRANRLAESRAFRRAAPLTKRDRDVLTAIARKNNFCPANPFNKPNFRISTK
jgi:hypothetical protein